MSSLDHQRTVTNVHHETHDLLGHNNRKLPQLPDLLKRPGNILDDGWLNADERLEQSGFAQAVAAHNGEDFLATHRKAEIVNDATLTVSDFEIADGKHSFQWPR